MSLVAFGSGFSIGFGLIAAIGAQNAHILRQGIFGQQILPCMFSFMVAIDRVHAAYNLREG